MENRHFRSLLAIGLIGLMPLQALADINYIVEDPSQDGNGAIEIDVVRAAQDGVVAAYALRQGALAEVLGQEPVFAGANSDVRINLSPPYRGDVVLMLFDGPTNSGPALDTLRVDRD